MPLYTFSSDTFGPRGPTTATGQQATVEFWMSSIAFLRILKIQEAWKKDGRFAAAVSIVALFYSWIDSRIQNGSTVGLLDFSDSGFCPDEDMMRNTITWYTEPVRPVARQQYIQVVRPIKIRLCLMRDLYKEFASRSYGGKLPNNNGSGNKYRLRLYIKAFIPLIKAFLGELTHMRSKESNTGGSADRFNVSYASVRQAILDADEKAYHSLMEQQMQKHREGAGEGKLGTAERAGDEAKEKALESVASTSEEAEKKAQVAEEQPNSAPENALQSPSYGPDCASAHEGAVEPSEGADSSSDRVAAKTEPGAVISATKEVSDSAISPGSSEGAPEKKLVHPSASAPFRGRSEALPILNDTKALTEGSGREDSTHPMQDGKVIPPPNAILTNPTQTASRQIVEHCLGSSPADPPNSARKRAESTRPLALVVDASLQSPKRRSISNGDNAPPQCLDDLHAPSRAIPPHPSNERSSGPDCMPVIANGSDPATADVRPALPQRDALHGRPNIPTGPKASTARPPPRSAPPPVPFTARPPELFPARPLALFPPPPPPPPLLNPIPPPILSAAPPQNNAAQQFNRTPQPVNWPPEFPSGHYDAVLQWIQAPTWNPFVDISYSGRTCRFWRDPRCPWWEIWQHDGRGITCQGPFYTRSWG